MLRNIIKGLLTFLPGSYNIFKKPTGGTDSARYCYSVWLRHLVMAYRNGFNTIPNEIAELGPGDSIGIGLAALISGIEKYNSFDVVERANLKKNISIFDELVVLFKNKENIPGEEEFPEIKPKLHTYHFPREIFTDDQLKICLNRNRLDKIRQSIGSINKKESMIHFEVPWYESKKVKKGSIDMIYSQAVLEHVEDLATTYDILYNWLKPGGLMSHQIDFKSHGITKEWNGHWTISDFKWKLVKGNRPYLINRIPHSQHIKLMKNFGFRIICDEVYKLHSDIMFKKLATRFCDMQKDDLNTSGAFIQATK